MAITGYVTGIPVFCDSGFVILSPISRALADRSNVSLAVMATALSGGLYATHCLVPPTPGPIAMAGTLDADLGLTILVGLLVSIPATLAAYLYAKYISSKIDIRPIRNSPWKNCWKNTDDCPVPCTASRPSWCRSS